MSSIRLSFQVKDCLLSTSGTSAFLTPEELTTEISCRFILEDENCTRRLFLQRSKMNPRVPTCGLKSIFRWIIRIALRELKVINRGGRSHVLSLWIVGRVIIRIRLELKLGLLGVMGGRVGIVGAELGDAHARNAWEGDKNISGIYRFLQFVSMVIDVLRIIFKRAKIFSL